MSDEPYGEKYGKSMGILGDHGRLLWQAFLQLRYALCTWVTSETTGDLDLTVDSRHPELAWNVRQRPLNSTSKMWYDWTTHDHTSHWILKVLTFHRDLSLQCHGALFFFSFGHVDHLAVFGLFDQRNSSETLLYRGLVIGTKGFSVPCDLVRPKRTHLAMIRTTKMCGKKAGCLFVSESTKIQYLWAPKMSPIPVLVQSNPSKIPVFL